MAYSDFVLHKTPNAVWIREINLTYNELGNIIKCEIQGAMLYDSLTMYYQTENIINELNQTEKDYLDNIHNKATNLIETRFGF